MGTEIKPCQGTYFTDRQKVRMQSGTVQFYDGVSTGFWAAFFPRPFIMTAISNDAADGGAPTVWPQSEASLDAARSFTYSRMLKNLSVAFDVANGQDWVDDNGDVQSNGQTVYRADLTPYFQQYFKRYINGLVPGGVTIQPLGISPMNYREILQPMMDVINFWDNENAHADAATLDARFLALQRYLFDAGGGELWCAPGYYQIRNDNVINQEPYATDFFNLVADKGSAFWVRTVELDVPVPTNNITTLYIPR